jgi:hypothetical protein
MQAKQAFCGSTLHCYPAQCCNDAGAKNTSEHFNTAGRSVKTGLIAVDVVSHWTWSVSAPSLTTCLHLCLMAADWQHAPDEPMTLQHTELFTLPAVHVTIVNVHLLSGGLAATRI